MTNEQVDIVNAALRGSFGDAAPVARLDEGYIAVDGWTIGEIATEVQSIKGVVKVPGFALDVAVPFVSRDEPDGVDVAEVFQNRSFYDVVLSLVGEIAKARANVVLEQMAMDEFVKQMEEDELLAKEYWSK